MKTILRIPSLLVLFCGIFAMTAAFGQTTYTWTGAGDGVSLANSANWDPNGLPSGATQDTALWDGRTTANLVITYGSTSLPSTGYGSQGINLDLSVNQTNSVQIISAGGTSAGVGVNFITLDAGSGAFTLGDTSANNLKVFGRPAGGIHTFTNNSTNAATIDPSVEWQAGGGAGYTYDFTGTGNWIVNSYLMPDNGAFSATSVEVDGPGTVFWSAGKTGAYNPNSALGPMFVTGGTLVLRSSGLFTGSANQAIANSGTLEYDAASQSQSLSGVISGTGLLQVNNGTLLLSGQSTYTGNTLLSGGELIVNGVENAGVSGPLGVGGVITFSGGTLGFSANNIFDYSSRFDPNTNQAYSFDTAGQNVTLAGNLVSSGGTLTKLGAGTLTLSGTNSYTGNTTVSVGKLVIEGIKSGSGNILVADSASLDITVTNTQVTPATLTLGTLGGATLEFDDVNSTTTAPLAAGTISAAGTVTVNINSGTLAPGHSYPLLSWTSGSAPSVSLGVLNGFIGTLSTNGNAIQVSITGTAYTWTGANNGNWDTSTMNWIQNGGPAAFANGGPVLFDDTASGTTSVTVNGVEQPASVTVNNSTLSYSIASSAGNDIAGSTGLIKSGTNTLTLSGGANAYTGVTTLSGGTLAVGALANGGSASDIGAAGSSAANLVLNGGALQYTGGAVGIDRLFTLGTGGGTIDSEGAGALAFDNTGALAYSGNGPRGLTLTGAETDNNTLAAVIADNGGPTTLSKNGVGTWILTGTNTYSGGTMINEGVLGVGAGGPSGSLGSGGVVDDAALDFNRTGTLTVSGAISGTGSVTNDGSGTVVLANNNSYTGGTTINAGTLQVGNGGSTGALDPTSPVIDNSTFYFNSSGQFTMQGNISGSGQLIVHGSGLLVLRGGATYSYNGGTTIDKGARLQIFSGNEGVFSGAGDITNNGTLITVRQDNNVAGITNNIIGTGKLIKDSNNPNNGDVTLMGTNTYTGGTFINGGYIILGDGTTPGAGSIIGNVTMTNFSVAAGNGTISELIFNHPAGDDLSFGGNISGAGSVFQNGADTLTLTGTNTYDQGTTINAGTLQVGSGGTAGSIGTGDVTDSGVLVFNRSDNLSFGGAIADSTGGAGSVVQMGAGTLTLSSSNLTYTGATTVSNGTLVVSGGALGGELDVNGGTIAPAASGSIGMLTVAGNMNINSGTVLVTLNKGLSPSNSMFTVLGSINYTGGSLKLVTAGTGVAVGDTFTIFNQPVVGGASMSIVASGLSLSNNLAVDGSVTVTAVTPQQPPTITTAVSGGQLTLSWPSGWTGLHVQVQTNTLAKGLSTNWVTIAGTDTTNSYTAPIANTNGCVFYRLAP